MQEAYVDIYGVPTRVQTWGRWIEESYTKTEPENIVLIIPGNPGCTVWILSHAGHELPESKLRSAPCLTDNEKIYGLQGQVNHKLAFIESYVPRNARIHFVGHSVGAYIILQLLKHSSIQSRTIGSYLLFPTIEYMAQTKNGWYMTNVVQYFIQVILLLTWIFTCLPYPLQCILIKAYIIFYSVLNIHLETIRNFLRPEILDKVFYMAVDEMYKVKERETGVLLANKSRIKLYYGIKDRWAPQRYCKQLQRDIPDINAEICTRHFEHAFVLKHPEEVAAMVSTWIKL